MRKKRWHGKWLLGLAVVCVVILLSACRMGESNSESTSKSTGERTSIADRANGSSSSPSNDMMSDQAVSGALEMGSTQQKHSSAYPPVSMMPPNGEAYDDMYFKHYGTNPFIVTEEDPLSTFAVDVDTGSYTMMRNYIQRGELPPEEAVRVEEFINYFPVAYEPPKEDAFSIHTDAGTAPFAKGYELLRVGVKGKEVEAVDRKDAQLIFVIDVSGSMNREDRLGLVKRSLRMLVEQLHARDQVGIVIYGSRGEVVLRPTSIDDKRKILQAIDQLQPGGSSNAEEGLRLAYRMAQEYARQDTINRIILCSDGVANVGETGVDGILKSIDRYAKDGITLSTLGFGMGNYNDVLMEQLANQGDGNYAYIDTFSEARRVLVEELTGTLQTIAKDVKLQVAFDPEYVERYRLLGYENRDVRDEDFRNDHVDAGEIGAGHTVTALYELKIKEEMSGTDSQVTSQDRLQEKWEEIRLRYEDPETGEVRELHQDISVSGGGRLNQETLFLASVAEYAELLRGSYWAKEGSLQAVLELAEASAQTSEQLAFVQLVKDALAIKEL